MKLNKSGFTLVELLAVLVILSAIMGVTIPNVSSSLERNSGTEKKHQISRAKMAAEIYVTDNKKDIYTNLIKYDSNSCYIKIEDLEKEGYLTSNINTDSNNNKINGIIQYTRPNTFEYLESASMELNDCMSE